MRNILPKCRYCKVSLKKGTEADICFSCEHHRGIVESVKAAIGISYHTALKSKQYWTEALDSILESETSKENLCSKCKADGWIKVEDHGLMAKVFYPCPTCNADLKRKPNYKTKRICLN